MIEFFKNAHHVVQALLAGCFTWSLTALGSAVVFLSKDLNRKVLDGSLGFAAGAMIFVVIEELIPEPQHGGHGDTATMGTMIGFAMMMAPEALFC